MIDLAEMNKVVGKPVVWRTTDVAGVPETDVPVLGALQFDDDTEEMAVLKYFHGDEDEALRKGWHKHIDDMWYPIDTDSVQVVAWAPPTDCEHLIGKKALEIKQREEQNRKRR